MLLAAFMGLGMASFQAWHSAFTSAMISSLRFRRRDSEDVKQLAQEKRHLIRSIRVLLWIFPICGDCSFIAMLPDPARTVSRLSSKARSRGCDESREPATTRNFQSVKGVRWWTELEKTPLNVRTNEESQSVPIGVSGESGGFPQNVWSRAASLQASKYR